MCPPNKTQTPPESSPPASESSSRSATAAASPSPPPGSAITSPLAALTSPTASPLPGISSSAPPTPTGPDLESQLIPLTQISIEDDKNGRAELDLPHARELAAQIGKDGLLHPITVRPGPSGFTLIAGRHRLEAFRILGWTHAPSVVKYVNDYTAGVLRMAENVSRSALSPAEEATQLAALLNQTPGGVDELAARTGRNVNWILDRLDMCDWPEALLQHVHRGTISLAAAKKLARIPDPETRDMRIGDAARSGINARTAALWLQQSVGDVQATPDLSENTTVERFLENPISSFSKCFCCDSETKLEHTRTVRLCENCIQELQKVKRTNNPHAMATD